MSYLALFLNRNTLPSQGLTTQVQVWSVSPILTGDVNLNQMMCKVFKVEVPVD